jgi:hypothetical protein
MKDFMSSLEFVKKTMHGLPPTSVEAAVAGGNHNGQGEDAPLPTGMAERYSQSMPLILPSVPVYRCALPLQVEF